MIRLRLRAVSCLPVLLLTAAPAAATYSIVATDSATQAVGGAVTSCVGAQGVLIVYGPAPGKGGINAQAAASAAGRDRGVQLLNMGTAPADIITQITAPSFDSQFNQRQYGVADLQGRAAAFTGTGTSVAMWRGSKQGTLGTYTYTIQGNVLTSGAVVDQAETAFRGGGCDLAEKMMLALEGGAQNSEGDDRCRPSIPSDAASIEVDLVGQTAGSYLKLSNANGSGQNAVTALRTQFNTWRQTHPCMQPDGGTPDASTDAGSKDASVTDVIGDRPDGGDSSVGGDASDGSAGTAGAAGQGGTAGTAGAAGSAGTAGTGGTSGTGGAAGSGGTTGGAGGAAGKSGAAGTSGSGGSAGTGTGGATGTGGTSGSGGTTGSGGASGSTAGTSSTGGRGGSGTTGGSAGSGGSSSDDGGCSCRVGRPGSAGAATFILSGLALMFAGRSRRSKRRRTPD
jgi:uncharacterized Ntn-hydrolase superfamily protein